MWRERDKVAVLAAYAEDGVPLNLLVDVLDAALQVLDRQLAAVDA